VREYKDATQAQRNKLLKFIVEDVVHLLDVVDKHFDLRPDGRAPDEMDAFLEYARRRIKRIESRIEVIRLRGKGGGGPT